MVKKLFSYALDVGLVAVLLFICFRPGGVILQPIQNWRAERQTIRGINERWTALTEAAPRLGNQGADAIVLVEFGDYECPFCGAAHPILEQFLVDHPEVALAYRHLPLTIHPGAYSAALASVCAEQQGHFAAMHRHLMEGESWGAGTPDWVAVGEHVGVPDVTLFLECMESPQARARVDDDTALAGDLEITSTPVFLTPKGKFPGVQREADLLEALGLIDR